MNIAITGGSGFIGTQLAIQLKAAGHSVRIIDLNRSSTFPDDTHIVDVRDLPALEKALQDIEVIYHLAAEHRDDVSPIQKYYDVNVEGGKNVIAAAKRHGIQTIVFTSTVAVYGLDAGESQETDTPAPFNDYGHSKYQSEQSFQSWAGEDPTRTLVILRLVATFGRGNRGNIYTLINQIASGKFLMIGNGKNQKSIAYVQNVAAFLVHVLTCPQDAHLYNYADKPDLTMRGMVADIRHSLGRSGLGPQLPYIVGILGGALCDVIAKITGRTLPISLVRVKKFCANTIVKADKVKETGFQARFTLEEGLADMIEAEFPANKKTCCA